jgi:hypothetical protein
MCEEERFAEISDRHTSGGAPKMRAKRGEVSTFFYDLLIIVAGIAGAVILLRLFAQAVTS